MNNNHNIALASFSFDSSVFPDIECGSNGLPLTLNSIKIIGAFKAFVEKVDHPCLTRYVECFRDKYENVTLVFEDYPSEIPDNVDYILSMESLLSALKYMHDVLQNPHGLISPESIVWSSQTAKLTHWPLHLITNGGSTLNSAALYTKTISYLAPELVRKPESKTNIESDIWSLCLSFLKIIKPSCKLPENPTRIAMCDTSKKVIDLIEGSLTDSLIENSDRWNEFFIAGLDPNPKNRPSIKELISILDFKHESSHNDSKSEIFDKIVDKASPIKNVQETSLDLSEIYYLWRLSTGRNFETKQDDYPPIFKIPYFIIAEDNLNNALETNEKNWFIFDTSSTPIPIGNFYSQLNALDRSIFVPRVSEDISFIEDISFHSSDKKPQIDCIKFSDLVTIKPQIKNSDDTKKLPVVIKEADFAYQCERILLFKVLLDGCPKFEPQLRAEANIDIPPYYRAKTWAVILGVSKKRNEQLYASISKKVNQATERQISVDIPRCHQYNELMASPQGHQKLTNILKAWLNYNKSEYVYWQGLDSLAAPFLLINFDDEATAFGCFNAFVNKYLHGFFRQDNQEIVEDYLSYFATLLSYHDPTLADHLDNLGFLPNLYAIPWFLTMFTHVLPLHKILHIWDKLLLGDEKYPLCIGLAILNQLRNELLEYNFNDCIVAFSDLPEIDTEKCIRDASTYYNTMIIN